MAETKAQEQSQGFDYTVTKRDPKTGVEQKRDDYAAHFSKDANGNVTQKLERPIGSGQFYAPDNTKIVIEGEVNTTVKTPSGEDDHQESQQAKADKKGK